MAGVSIQIDIRDEQVRQNFDSMLRALTNPRPALAEIGELVVESVQRNFEEHRAPDGTAWTPLSPAYKKWKVEKKGRNASDILILNRILMGSVHWKIFDNEVRIGTPIVYGRRHQLGDDIMPKREYLGIRDSDWPKINGILSRFIIQGRM